MATKRALIVDDSRTAQHRLKKMLRAYDLDIVAVDSAESALSYLSSTVPDVVFMDHLMPGMDGFRALQIIKSHPATATIPVIMYTSKSGDVYTSQARALGALDVVSKDTINAADLSHVLKAIHIYREDSQERADKLEEKSGQPSQAHPEPEPELPSAPEASNLLSLELRLRELEHTIDDNRRIVTSRLVREMQGVRHLVNKLSTDLGELKQAGEEHRAANAEHSGPESDKAPRSAAGFGRWAFAAVLVGLGGLGWWQISGHLDTLQLQQAQQSEQLGSALAAFERARSQTGDDDQRLSRSAAPTATADASQQYLPALSWAVNQSSVQDFHADLVAPQTAQRLNELIARLSSQNFRGQVQVSVNAGDFCVVTDMGGQPQLPDADSRMDNCALISEFYGLDMSEAIVDRLSTLLAESSMLVSDNMEVTIEPLDRVFRDYPSMGEATSAHEWNEAARLNNRVLVSLKPEAPLSASAD